MAKKPNRAERRLLEREVEALKHQFAKDFMADLVTDGRLRDHIRRTLDALPEWTPFEDVTDELSSPLARQLGVRDPQILLKANQLLGVANKKTRMYRNSRYFVKKTPLEEGGWMLSIRTTENDARHDWREFQRIKNELCGPECEAIELYPAESRLVDTANQYWVHVLPEGMRIPVGFNDRLVMKPGDGSDGTTQRPWEPGDEPPDARDGSLKSVMTDLYDRAKKALNEEKDRGENAEPEGDRGEVRVGEVEDEHAAHGAADDAPRIAHQAGLQPGERGEGREGAGPGGEDHGQAGRAAEEGGEQVQRRGGQAQEEGQEDQR